MWGPATTLRYFIISASTFVAFGLLCNYILILERPTIPHHFPFGSLVKELGEIEAIKVSVSSLIMLKLMQPHATGIICSLIGQQRVFRRECLQALL